MADYPFKINIQTKDGSKFSYYTSSFATDATGALSASVVENIISTDLRAVQYTESIDAPSADVAADHFGHSSGGGVYLSTSVSGPNTGSIIFTDTETTTNGGLDHYIFYGTKVCSVLGLPEGIKIRPETFRFSDDDNNPDNYMSGDLISDSIQLKQGFKMAPQARMQSNLVWDDLNGEGFIQWVSGSKRRAFMGYDETKDLYSLLVSQITGSTVKATTFTGALAGNATSATTATNLSNGTVSLGLTQSGPDSPGFVFKISTLGSQTGLDDNAVPEAQYPIVISGSNNGVGHGGDIILQGGHNQLHSVGNVRGGNITVRPGTTGLGQGGIGRPGFFSDGKFVVSGSSEITGDITGSGNLSIGGTLNGRTISTLLDGTNGTDNEIAVFTDANSVEGDADFTWDGDILNIKSGTSSRPQVIIDNSNSNANGAQLIIQKSTTGEADNDSIGNIIFRSNNSSHAIHSICRINATVRDVSAGTEDGEMVFYAHVAGTETDILTLADGTGATSYFSNPLGVGAAVSTGTLYIKPTSQQRASLAAAVNRGLHLSTFSDVNANDEFFPPVVWHSNDPDLDSGYDNVAFITAIAHDAHNGTTNRSKLILGTANNSTGMTEHFRIDFDGTLTATDTTISSNSDIRTKTNIVDYTGPTTGSMSGSTSLELIESLNMKHFEYNGDYGSIKGKKRAGVIAQEITGSVPYIVTSDNHRIDENWYTENEDGSRVMVTPTGSMTEIYNVALGDLVPDMINAIKDLSQQVKTLRAQISGSG